MERVVVELQDHPSGEGGRKEAVDARLVQVHPLGFLQASPLVCEFVTRQSFPLF